MNDYKKGMVSVVIPTYKRSELLKKAIDTVLNQTYSNLELLIVNDNVPGDSYSKSLYSLLSTYKDNRIKLVEQEKHINGAAARNAGIMQACGEYIAFQDDDDYWEPQKLELQVSLLAQLDDEYGAVACLMRLYKNGSLIMSSLPYKSGNILVDILDRKTSMGTGALLIRRKALDNVGYFDESLTRHQDLQLFAYLTSKYKVKLDKIYLHNREIKDNQNRPNADKLTKIKADYFNSIDPVMQMISQRNRKKVYIMHDFECAYVFLKSGNRIEGLKKLFSIFKMPETLFLAIHSMYRRFISKAFKNQLNSKYCVEISEAKNG